jgi:hypothetical protein
MRRVTRAFAVEKRHVPKAFSPATLGEFEAASASIPLRQLDRAFQNSGIRLGKDPGGPDGARRAQFRRYIASVDQHDPQQLGRLGDVLGALIDEVARSKQEFLVKAAERDGFVFAEGVFRPAGTSPRSFAVTRFEGLASIGDRAKRLYLLANESPADAIGGANELVESVCRTALHLIGERAPRKTADLVDIANSTLDALERIQEGSDVAKKGAALVRTCLQQLGVVVARLGELRNADSSLHGVDERWNGPSPRHARLAVGAAVTFADFIAETCREWAELKTK